MTSDWCHSATEST